MSAPDTKRPAGHCDSDDAWAEFERQYRGQPRSYGHLSDFALANAVFMADRNDLDLIVYQTAGKERIRWLSLRLAAAEAASVALLAALKTAEAFISGFEDDELQEGVGEILATMRAVIAEASGGQG
jgi:hypothetical protein